MDISYFDKHNNSPILTFFVDTSHGQAGEMTPIQVMNMLNALYMEFDKLAEKHNVYKVETIG